jgi:hypothetical protein
MDEPLIYYDLSRPGRAPIIEALRRVLLGDGRVVVAVVFGSFLRRLVVQDIDVAVHAVPPLSLDDVLSLGLRLEEAVGVPVDVVPFEGLPPCRCLRVLTEGLKLVVRDVRALHRLTYVALAGCEDLKLILAHSGKG